MLIKLFFLLVLKIDLADFDLGEPMGKPCASLVGNGSKPGRCENDDEVYRSHHHMVRTRHHTDLALTDSLGLRYGQPRRTNSMSVRLVRRCPRLALLQFSH